MNKNVRGRRTEIRLYDALGYSVPVGTTHPILHVMNTRSPMRSLRTLIHEYTHLALDTHDEKYPLMFDKELGNIIDKLYVVKFRPGVWP